MVTIIILICNWNSFTRAKAAGKWFMCNVAREKLQMPADVYTRRDAGRWSPAGTAWKDYETLKAANGARRRSGLANSHW